MIPRLAELPLKPRKEKGSLQESAGEKPSNGHNLQEINIDRKNLAANHASENKASYGVGATEDSIDALHIVSQPAP